MGLLLIKIDKRIKCLSDEDIESQEYDFIESCPNGGLTYFNQEYKTKLTEIPSEFEYGIYRCKVTCNHPDILKVFAFSRKNTYTSTSLHNALFLMTKKRWI